ncbi:MAG TPA: hypothetical protein VK717_12820 [Opitutaceae bacterium]|nr:hypothetical protein [Opitutaceae bacterium]
MAADTATPATGGSAPQAMVAAAEPAAPKFSATQLARVGGWMQAMAPAAPPAAIAAATQHFLEDLQWQHPDKLDLLLTGDFPRQDFESTLLRNLAAQLAGAPQAALREELARRRVQTLLAFQGGAAQPTAQDAAALIEKLKGISQVYYRRLLEGRIEDEDLVPLLKDARQTGTATSPAAAMPKVLTAADILSEFSRHNQTGSALEHLQAYTIDGRLKPPDGGEQHIVLFKLRPDRFRLHVLTGESMRYLLASDGAHFWQQTPGGKPQDVAADSIGSRRYLREFVNPLFDQEKDYAFERLADGSLDGRKTYRIAVRRTDGSQYVACIDPDSFHEIGGEYQNGVRVRYSDFQAIAGFTMACREETVDREGRKGVFELTRFTANPGLVQEFFDEPAEGRDLSYFAFEQLSTGAPAVPQAKN